MKISTLKAFGEEAVAQIESINHSLVVAEVSQIVSDLKDIRYSQNFLLYIVIPDIYNSGSADAIQKNHELELLLLYKRDDSDSYASYIDYMDQTKDAIEALELYIINHRYNNAPCSMFAKLNEAQNQFSPITGFSGCIGWSLNVTIPE